MNKGDNQDEDNNPANKYSGTVRVRYIDEETKKYDKDSAEEDVDNFQPEAKRTELNSSESFSAEEARQMIARNSERLALMEKEMNRLRHRISEREKELACHMLLSNLLDEITQASQNTTTILNEVVSILPPAMQYPDICAARIVLNSKTYSSPHWKDTPWKISAEIRCTYPEMRQVGTVEIAYISDPRLMYSCGAEEGGELSPDDDPSRAFLPEEISLLSVVAERVGNLLSRNCVKEKISRLTDHLALCTECHRVRDSDGLWKTFQAFLEEHSNVTFNDLYCPTCAERILSSSSSTTGTTKTSSPNTTEK